MIVLDTNVVSELMRPEPNAVVLSWVDGLPVHELRVTAVTVAEVLYGIARLADGRRRRALADAFDAMVHDEFAGAVLAFDTVAAAHYADIVVTRERARRPVSTADAQIAAITRSHGASLATRDAADFVGIGLSLVDPWAGRPPA